MDEELWEESWPEEWDLSDSSIDMMVGLTRNESVFDSCLPRKMS